MYSFVSGFFYSAKCLYGLSLVGFYSFLFLSNIPLCEYPKMGKRFEQFTNAFISMACTYVKKMLSIICHPRKCKFKVK